ncbi:MULTISPECIES: hypothetical protein [Cellulosimicrobium]|uniref:hypothetical protein n=1 Tax=Cellulosimicrobium TaxID=157920 RepID=UPI0011A4C725|nr:MULTISPECIES: hypothetical protein [Cellulosimicrobium]MBE9940245.1 hypothetical protein [Cellulosimicrobium cellulans]
MRHTYACTPSLVRDALHRVELTPLAAVVFTASAADARRLLLDVGLRGRPERTPPFDLAVAHPDVVVWRTVEQAENGDEWNIGTPVAEYARIRTG